MYILLLIKVFPAHIDRRILKSFSSKIELLIIKMVFKLYKTLIKEYMIHFLFLVDIFFSWNSQTKRHINVLFKILIMKISGKF